MQNLAKVDQILSDSHELRIFIILQQHIITEIKINNKI